MSITDYKQRDRTIVEELGIRQIARVVGYDCFGSPIELVYDLDTDSYEWNIGGEYIKDASPLVVIQIFSKEVAIVSQI